MTICSCSHGVFNVLLFERGSFSNNKNTEHTHTQLKTDKQKNTSSKRRCILWRRSMILLFQAWSNVTNGSHEATRKYPPEKQKKLKNDIPKGRSSAKAQEIALWQTDISMNISRFNWTYIHLHSCSLPQCTMAGNEDFPHLTIQILPSWFIEIHSWFIECMFQGAHFCSTEVCQV